MKYYIECVNPDRPFFTKGQSYPVIDSDDKDIVVVDNDKDIDNPHYLTLNDAYIKSLFKHRNDKLAVRLEY